MGLNIFSDEEFPLTSDLLAGLSQLLGKTKVLKAVAYIVMLLLDTMSVFRPVCMIPLM